MSSQKRQSLETLAHELRGSLASLRNVAQMLEAPDAAATTLPRAREIMNRQIESMARLIDDLLDSAGSR